MTSAAGVNNHLLLVYANPKSPEREDEFNAWWNNYFLQQVLCVPGFVAATRYKLARLQMDWFPPMTEKPQWPHGKDTYLTVFEIDPSADLAHVFEQLRATELNRITRDPENDPVAWGPQLLYEPFTVREPSVWPRPGGPAPERPDGVPNHIFVVPISPLSADLEDDFNAWYITQGNVRRNGIAAGTRWRLSRTQGVIDSRAPRLQGEYPFGQHLYVMIYELYDAIAAYNDLGASVRVPRPAGAQGGGRFTWMMPWGGLRRVDEHLVYEPVTYRVTPAFTH